MIPNSERTTPTAAVNRELEAPVLLSEEDMTLVAGAGWFGDIVDVIKSGTPPVLPSILSAL